jgi:hypothetical protein
MNPVFNVDLSSCPFRIHIPCSSYYLVGSHFADAILFDFWCPYISKYVRKNVAHKFLGSSINMFELTIYITNIFFILCVPWLLLTKINELRTCTLMLFFIFVYKIALKNRKFQIYVCSSALPTIFRLYPPLCESQPSSALGFFFLFFVPSRLLEQAHHRLRCLKKKIVQAGAVITGFDKNCEKWKIDRFLV